MNAPLPLFLVIAVVGLGCAPQDVVVADSNDSFDGGDDAPPDGPPPCLNDAECDVGFFCKKTSCEPGATATCVQLRICGGDYNPVCACNGTTYWNECMSDRDRQGVRFNSECPDEGRTHFCQGHGPGACDAPHSYCSPLGMVAAVCPPQPVTGKCWVVPGNCAGTSNDATRWNACSAVDACVDTCTAIKNGFPFNADDAGCVPQ